MDYKDYDAIMAKELQQFEAIKDLSSTNVKLKFNQTRKKCNSMTIDLHEENSMAHQGIKNKNGQYKKNFRPAAKYFSCHSPVYTYPLFNTHKLTEKELTEKNKHSRFPNPSPAITRIYTYLKIHRFSWNVTSPYKRRYCTKGINDLCKDSKHYLIELVKWKNSKLATANNNLIFISTCDVKSLYLNIKRCLIERALSHALETHSSFNQQAQNIIVRLTMLCLESVILQYRDVTF